jgi:methyl coenzyme M reductase alpha subunit
LVQLQSVEAKITLFKNVHYLTALPKYTDINVSNDLTKTERVREKELWEEAKKMNDKDDSGDYKYKMGAPLGQESGQDKEVK